MRKLQAAIRRWIGAVSREEVESIVRQYRNENLARAEAEITRAASQTTLAIYDLVEQAMTIQHTLEERNDSDKP